MAAKHKSSAPISAALTSSTITALRSSATQATQASKEMHVITPEHLQSRVSLLPAAKQPTTREDIYTLMARHRTTVARLVRPVNPSELSPSNQPVFARCSDSKFGFIQLPPDQLHSFSSDVENALTALDIDILYVFAIVYESAQVWRGHIIGTLQPIA